jgi:hypothetical protein
MRDSGNFFLGFCDMKFIVDHDASCFYWNLLLFLVIPDLFLGC